MGFRSCERSNHLLFFRLISWRHSRLIPPSRHDRKMMSQTNRPYCILNAMVLTAVLFGSGSIGSRPASAQDQMLFFQIATGGVDGTYLVANAAETHDVKFLSLKDPTVGKLLDRLRFLNRYTIPAGMYRRAGDVETLSVGSALLS